MVKSISTGLLWQLLQIGESAQYCTLKDKKLHIKTGIMVLRSEAGVAAADRKIKGENK